ncbi:hypothetical protein DH2020_045524 [Rehmannia glutinosa]|uniref:Uncharacterized protein n=1 Tax=Rehmannia glutinosa TaxID=99300 RepID=A0ABR0UDW7_REHGL
MGSSSSHLVSSESPSPIKLSGSGGSILNRTKRKLSLCFVAFSLQSQPFRSWRSVEKSSISCTEYLTPFDAPQNSTLEPSSVITSETGVSRTIHQNGDSSERNSCVIEEAFLESDLLNVQTRRDFEPLPHQPAQESVSAAVDARDAMTGSTTFIRSGHDQSTSQAEGPTISQAYSDDLDYNQDAVVGYNGPDLRSLSIVSDSLPQFRFPGDDDDHAHVTTTSSSGFLVSDSDQDLTSGDLIHLDLVSISSNFLSK